MTARGRARALWASVAITAAGGSASLEAQTATSASPCTSIAEVALYDLAGTRAVLARALGITEEGRSPGKSLPGRLFRSANRSEAVCLDSVPALARWLEPRGAEAPLSVAPTPARAALSSNSAYARGGGDGVLWNGVGVNATATAGVEARWRFLSAAIRPVMAYHQNADFEVAKASANGHSEFANADRPTNIDWPKRPGDEAFSAIDPGDSFIHADVGPLAVALSNENLWMGPGQVRSVLLTDNAPGFPHLSVSTREPIDVWIGSAEASVFWGQVSESDYFDTNTANDEHLFTGTLLTLEPRGLSGLHLGLGRVYHDESAFGDRALTWDLLITSPVYTGGGNAEGGNAIGALFARWVLPESGFEVYLEWALEDTAYDWIGLLREPDDTRVWLAGFQKVFLSEDRLVRLFGESMNLAQSATVRGGRGFFSAYTHARVRQGHTHRGQLLGAWVGPGSDAQIVGADVFTASRRVGGSIERIRYDDDTYYRTYSRRYAESRHDVEVTAEARWTELMGPLEIDAALLLSRRYDRDFNSARNERPGEAETNVGMRASVTWRP